MQEITIDENTKGVLVLVKPDNPSEEEWVVLIESTEPYWRDGVRGYAILRHVSYCITYDEEDELGYIGTEPGIWGYTFRNRFYKPTKSQREKLKNFMFKNGYRFDKQNNKLIEA